tara:strand:- start:944 stop:1540 length:597 start_codon:yes stop_codon:yes gene_type:complete
MKLLKETLRDKIVPGLMKRGPTTSPIKRWLGVTTLGQSESIRFGTHYEEGLNDYVALSPLYTNITTSQRKTYITPAGELTNLSTNNKDVDILFARDKIIFYRECKCNLLLDSEKSKTTADKVMEVKRRLEQAFPGHAIDAAILCMDWSGTKQEYCGVPLEYVGDFINRLEVEETITETEYLTIGQQLGKEIVNNAANH